MQTEPVVDTSIDPPPITAPIDSEVQLAFAPVLHGVEIPRDYVPLPDSNHILYQVATPSFEGPLDLLLFLIRRHKLDIFDIPIAFMCSRYMEYLNLMDELNIDVASEFLFMAAELVHIKSRMLLPKPSDGTPEEEVDPRAELVRRLLEYEKFKTAAEDMDGLVRLGRDVFERPAEVVPRTPEQELGRLKEVSVMALVGAFADVLKRQKPEVRHKVLVETISLRDRMLALVTALQSQESMLFVDMVRLLGTRRIDVIVTFLAILEMTRLKLLRVYESDEGNLYVQPKEDVFDNAVERIQGLDESGYAG